MSSTPLSSLAPAAVLLAAGAAGAYLSGLLPGTGAASTSSPALDSSDELSVDRELPRGAWTKPLAKAGDLKGPIRVTQLWIHPIKSCRGTSVQQARYTPVGLENDRKWAIMDAKSRKILTARDLPKMVLIHPVMNTTSSSSSGEGVLRVEFPTETGLGFDVPLNPSTETLQKWELLGDVAIWHWSGVEGYICQSLSSSSSAQSPSDQLSTFLGRPVVLVMKGPRLRKSDPSYAFPSLVAPVDFQDGYPLLLASEESLDASNERVHGMVGQKGVSEDWKEKKLDMQRFRPNIAIAGAGVPFAEDGFKHIVVVPAGSAGQGKSDPISIVSKCTRCRLPNVDPATAEVDAAVPFKVLMSFRTALAKEEGMFSKSCFGVNGAPTGEGVIRVGDTVEVTEWLNEEWK